MNTEQNNPNHLADIHAGKVEVKKDEKIVTNHYENEVKASSEEQLGETPEVLPTHIGGVKLETEEEPTETPDTNVAN